MTLQAEVSKFLENNTNAKLKDLENKFPNRSKSSLKSCFYRSKKVATEMQQDATYDKSKITMDQVEKLIIKGKTPVPLLRVMTDFLKIKQQDHSELQEVDLTKFYKKAMED
jgi:hypothetical protein